MSTRVALVALFAHLLASACGPGAGSAPPASADATEAEPAPHAATTGPAAASAPPAVAPAPPPNPPAGKSPSRVEARTFQSPSLGVSKSYQVYLPPGYDDSARRFPVVTLLHGLGGNERNWLEHGGLAKAADAAALGAIVVMPDGDASFYVDRATQPPLADCLREKPPFNPGEPPATYCVKTPRYAAYVTEDLARDVDATYRTLPKREARGIAGLSMGGFGALSLALRHPDRYGVVAAHSALASLLFVGPRPFDAAKLKQAASPAEWGQGYPANVRDHVRGVFGPGIEAWRAHDPAALAATPAAARLAIYFDCGTEDEFGFADHARHLDHVLTQRGVPHTFELAPGRHDFTYWKARLPRSLAFLAQKLARD